MFCRQHGFDLTLVDVGVDHDLSDCPAILNRKIAPHGTRNFLYESAMSETEAEKCLALGRELVDNCRQKGCNILCIGEMGIGNTSPSSLWMSELLNIPLAQCVGAGAGLGSEGIRHKLHVLSLCQQRVGHTTDTRVLMREYGGFEMVTAVGAMLRAAEQRMVVLVDGFIMTACALMASRIDPNFLATAVFCHQGDEAGHSLMLGGMGVRGLLQLGLRLGEGTGALCAYPIVESAVRMINEMNNFDNAKITKYF